jgi:hypothetical protein
VLLVISVVWQVFVIGGQASALGEAKEIAHALLHWQGVAHHHHNDGSVMHDGSDESIQHLAIDGALNLAAIWFVIPSNVTPDGALPPLVGDEAGAPAPHLAGLERPPKRTA